MHTRSQVFIITGDPQEGKTTFVMKLIERLKLLGYTPGGFVAPGKFRNNQRFSFHLTDLKSGKTKSLCTREAEGEEQIGPFVFFSDGQQFGRRILEPENLKDCDFVVVDEVGPLELQGKGWANSLKKLLASDNQTHIWVVRKNLVESVVRYFGITEFLSIDIEKESPEDAIKKLIG